MIEEVEEGNAKEEAALKAAIAEAFGRAQFGLVVEDFLGSPIGRYLCLRAEKERSERLEQLAQLDAHDAANIAKVQQRIRVCDSWQHWLTDAIAEGEAAHQQLVESGH